MDPKKTAVEVARFLAIGAAIAAANYLMGVAKKEDVDAVRLEVLETQYRVDLLSIVLADDIFTWKDLVPDSLAAARPWEKR